MLLALAAARRLTAPTARAETVATVAMVGLALQELMLLKSLLLPMVWTAAMVATAARVERVAERQASVATAEMPDWQVMGAMVEKAAPRSRRVAMAATAETRVSPGPAALAAQTARMD